MLDEVDATLVGISPRHGRADRADNLWAITMMSWVTVLNQSFTVQICLRAVRTFESRTVGHSSGENKQQNCPSIRPELLGRSEGVVRVPTWKILRRSMLYSVHDINYGANKGVRTYCGTGWEVSLMGLNLNSVLTVSPHDSMCRRSSGTSIWNHSH